MQDRIISLSTHNALSCFVTSPRLGTPMTAGKVKSHSFPFMRNLSDSRLWGKQTRMITTHMALLTCDSYAKIKSKFCCVFSICMCTWSALWLFCLLAFVFALCSKAYVSILIYSQYKGPVRPPMLSEGIGLTELVVNLLMFHQGRCKHLPHPSQLL